LGSDTFTLAHQTQEEMFCSNVMMVQAVSFIYSEFDHFFGAWSEANFTKNNAISTTYHSFNSFANLVQFDAEVAQYFGGDPFSFTYKTEQEVFGADVIVLEALGFFLSET